MKFQVWLFNKKIDTGRQEWTQGRLIRSCLIRTLENQRWNPINKGWRDYSIIQFEELSRDIQVEGQAFLPAVGFKKHGGIMQQLVEQGVFHPEERFTIPFGGI